MPFPIVILSSLLLALIAAPVFGDKASTVDPQPTLEAAPQKDTLVLALTDAQVRQLRAEDGSDAIAVELTGTQRAQFAEHFSNGGPRSLRLSPADLRSGSRIAVVVNPDLPDAERLRVLPASVILPAIPGYQGLDK